MHTIINGCVLFLWLQTLTFVKSQDCTLEQFLNSRLYDSNFDTTGLQASYPGGKQVRVSCSVGYSGFFKLICVEGRWQSRGSRCQPVECKLKLPPLEGTQYEPALRSAFSPGDKVKVVCGENYWILNHQTTSTEILCQDDGSWNHTPVCQEIVCSNDRDPLLDYWGVSYWSQNKVGDTAFYGCKSGYKSTDGGDEATCTRDGWTPKPLCQAPSHCGSPPTLEDGDTVGTTREQYNQNDRVQYSCQSYYTMEGGPYKTCINGQWTGDIRCLKACTVDREAMTRRNIRFKYSYQDKIYSTHNDEIEFMCTRGSPVGGVRMRQRCLHGVIELPICK